MREVAERVSADPLLYCKNARIGLTLSPYEDDLTGDPIDLSDPAIALEPLSAVAAHLLARRFCRRAGAVACRRGVRDGGSGARIYWRCASEGAV